MISRITEKRTEVSLETHVAFIDFEKAFDLVVINRLYTIMEESGYAIRFLQTIKNLSDDSKTTINRRFKSIVQYKYWTGLNI